LFCTACGKENPDSAGFCWSCGRELFKQPDSPQPFKVETKITAVRDGRKLIVASNDAVLHEVCVSCGAPGSFHSYRFAWIDPGYFALFFLGIAPYFIARFFLRKTARLHVPLCERHHNRYHRLGTAGTVILVASLPVSFLVASVIGDIEGNIWGFVSVFGLAVVGLVLLWAHYPLRATLIDDDRAVFNGACEDFLKLLPPRLA
jgi:double zinc ribbon protein